MKLRGLTGIAAVALVGMGSAPGLARSEARATRERFPHAEESTLLTLPEPLSMSEREILRLLNNGATNQEIADKLGTTVGTTKWHLNQIFGKLQVRNRTGAVVRARAIKIL